MTKENIKKVLLQKKDILNRYKVKSIAIFGSYVRGEQKEDSDIDLLVEFGKGATLFDFIDLQDSLSEVFGKGVSIVSRRGLSKYIGPYILEEAETVA